MVPVPRNTRRPASPDGARAGHQVVALDNDEEAIAVAGATLRTDHNIRTSVTYHHCDVAGWYSPPESFDVAVVSRVLHHLDDLHDRMADVRRWLRPDGRLVCLDFAYDRFDHRSARWLAQVRSLLEAVDAYDTRELAGAEPSAAIDRVLRTWWRDHSHGRGHRSIAPRSSWAWWIPEVGARSAR